MTPSTSKKKPAQAGRFAASLTELFFESEVVLGSTAHGADPVIRQSLEGGAGFDIVVGIANFGVVDIAANVANVFLHDSSCS
jgi:hypothetical protein